MSRTLSKTDFKLAQTCPTKLYYKELHYPTIDDDDLYLKLLSDGGYMVEKMAKLQFADGIEMEYSHVDVQANANRTVELLQSADHIVLFEATLVSGVKLARVDILVKRGNEFDLLEVKAKSWDGAEAAKRAADGLPAPFRGVKGGIIPDWKPYLEDVTYQVMLLRELFPDAIIHPYLVMPDKAKTTSIDELYRYFSIRLGHLDGSPIEKIEVAFTGDVAALRADDFLSRVPVDAEVAELSESVRLAADHYAWSLNPQLVKIEAPITVECRDCEFHRTAGDARDGFMECWGPLGSVDPHLFDMYSVGKIGSTRDPIANHLIASGKACLFDIDAGLLKRKDGTEGPQARRQRIQLECTRTNKEWVSDGLGPLLDTLEYPLHFIDFETSRLAIPYHVGMRPYGLVAFQWSCHTIKGPGRPIEHTEWLNSEKAFPNFEFANSLRQQLGETGSVLTWATHEESSLKDVRSVMPGRQYVDLELAEWIERLTADGSGRIVDMNKITREHYFHPLMKGRTSIKWVLAAVWASDLAVRSAFPEYAVGESSPYEALPSIEIGGKPLRVKEGTEAMRAYQEMMYGAGQHDAEVKRRYATLLLQYCRLDTAAMIMIYDHWRRCRPG